MVTVPGFRVSIRRLILISSITTVLALVSLGVLLLGTRQAGPPRGGLTRTQAIQAAWEHVDPGALSVATADVRQDFNTGFDLPVHPWAWVVTFNGHWQLLCQGGPEGCNPTTEWVAIDYYAGSWIASEYSYPVSAPSGPRTPEKK
jgi:hypothetical protein